VPEKGEKTERKWLRKEDLDKEIKKFKEDELDGKNPTNF